MTLAEITQNWWKHGAGLEKRLEEAAKTLLSSMRGDSDFSGFFLWPDARLLELLYRTRRRTRLFELHILIAELHAEDKALEAAQ